jgi:protein AbiQ
MEKNLDFYNVDTAYVDYLLRVDGRVPKTDYSTENRHDKFLCGIVMAVNGNDYFAPISSFKTKQRTNIVIKDEKGNGIASIRFSFMIPIPPGVASIKRISDEKSPEHRILLNKELHYCRKNADAIRKKAHFVYHATVVAKDPLFVRNCCDFATLEAACAAYPQASNVGGLPFDQRPARPNAETLAAMREAESISRNPSVKGYRNMTEFFMELESDK